jgi:hypothetical protein
VHRSPGAGVGLLAYSPAWYNTAMTEERTPILYSAAFFAWREENGQPTIHIKPGIVIAFTVEDAQRDGMEGAFVAFPPSDNWTGQGVTLTELPNNIELGHYHVSWQAVRRSP